MSDPAAQVLSLNLAETIALALNNSRNVLSAQLNRITQKASLELAEARYLPDADIRLSTRYNDSSRYHSSDATSNISLHIPTGGQFSFAWDNTLTDQGGAGTPAEYGTALRFSFSQPLLRNAGPTIDRAPLTFARRAEQSNVFSFKSTIMGIVTSVIRSYWSLQQAESRFAISELSLQRSKETLEINRKLVEAGRMARFDVIQAEANLADRELSLSNERNALDEARLSLINILDIDSSTRFKLTEPVNISVKHPNLAHSMELARQHRPDYQRLLLEIKNAELSLLLAKNRRWRNLDATASMDFRNAEPAYSYSRLFDDLKSDYNVGLNLSIPLTDRAARQGVISAEVSLRQVKLSQLELEQSIDVEVRNAVRNVTVGLRQAELAKKARELSERKLELGLTNNFQLITYEDDLVRAQNNEIAAIIAYRNNLTSLDLTLGTTLQSWGIDVQEIDTLEP